MIDEMILCTLGSVFFAVTMRVPKRSLIYVAIGAGSSSVISIALIDELGYFTPCVISMLVLTLYSDICARALKQPATIILLPSTIPLLPGSYIYYSMLCAINGDSAGFIEYGKATVLTGLGITVGAILSGIITSAFNALCRR